MMASQKDMLDVAADIVRSIPCYHNRDRLKISDGVAIGVENV